MPDEPTVGEALRRCDRTDRDLRDLRADIPRWIAEAIRPVADDVREIKERSGSTALRVTAIIGAVVGIATLLVAVIALASHGGG